MNVTKNRKPKIDPAAEEKQESLQDWMDDELPQIVSDGIDDFRAKQDVEVVLDEASLKKVQEELTKMLKSIFK